MPQKNETILAPRPRLPSLRSIMRSRRCSLSAARTILAELECDIDSVVFSRTELHTLKCYTDLDKMWKDLLRKEEKHARP